MIVWVGHEDRRMEHFDTVVFASEELALEWANEYPMDKYRENNQIGRYVEMHEVWDE